MRHMFFVQLRTVAHWFTHPLFICLQESEQLSWRARHKLSQVQIADLQSSTLNSPKFLPYVYHQVSSRHLQNLLTLIVT